LLVANWLALVGIVTLRLRQRRLLLLDPAWPFLLGMFINYCVKPALFLLAPSAVVMYDIYTDADTIEQQMPIPLSMSLVFLICFAIVDLLPSHNKRVTRRADWGRFAGSPVVYDFSSIMLIVGGAVAFALLLRQLNWQGTWLSLLTGSARSQVMLHNEGNGHYIFAMHLSQLGWCVFCFNRGLAISRNRIAAYLIRPTLFLLAVAVPLALGQRFGVIVVTTAAAFLLGSSMWRLLSGGLRMRRVLLALALGAIIAGPIGLILKQREINLANSVAMATSAWDSLELFVIGDPIESWSFLYGRSYMEDIVFSYIPRAWVSKPERYGMRAVQDVVTPVLARSNGTYPPGMVLEAYVNFGWIGVTLVPILIAKSLAFVRTKLLSGSAFWLAQVLVIWISIASFRGFGGVLAQCLADSIVLGIVVAMALAVSSVSSSRNRIAHPYTEGFGWNRVRA